jgi:hypothetical protein
MKWKMNILKCNSTDNKSKQVNPHPKDLNKSPTFVGFFVCGMMCRFG